MNEEFRQVSESTLRQCLPILEDLFSSDECPKFQRTEWKRSEKGQWTGETTLLPNLNGVIVQSHSKFEIFGKDFLESLNKHYPETLKYPAMTDLYWMPLSKDKYLSQLLARYVELKGSFEICEDTIAKTVHELGLFLECEPLKFFFRSELFYFSSNSDVIELTQELRIRRMQPKEIEESISLLPLTHNTPFREFMIEGQFQIDARQKPETVIAELTGRLDQVLMALRTYKSGSIRVDAMRFFSTTLVPAIKGFRVYQDRSSPFGVYQLTDIETEDFKEHFDSLTNVEQKKLGLACRRLSYSETRFRHDDAILDAVIGMESILLQGCNFELKYRFAMNYSILFPVNEREAKFKEAKKIYDLRCDIAHGNKSNSHFLDHEVVQTKEALRFLIKYFLRNNQNFDIDSWRFRLLGTKLC